MAIVNVNKWLDEARMNRFHMLTFFLCICVVTFDGYDLVIYGAAVPLLLKEFGMSAAQAGVIGSYALFGAAVGALIFGWLADKIGRKKVIVICTVLFSVATGATGLANGPDAFAICRFLAGLGIGGAMPNIVALASEYAPAKNRALVIAVIFSGMQIGGIAAAGLSMWLFPLVGWRPIFYIGALPLLLVPVFLKSLPESPVRLIDSKRIDEIKAILRKLRPEEILPDDITLDIVRTAGKASVKDVFRENRGLSTLIIWIVYFMNMYMIFGLGIWLPKLMMDAGFGLGSGLWFLLVLQFAAFFGSQLAGVLADWFGAKTTMVGAYLIAFAAIAFMAFTKNFYLLSALVALAGSGYYAGQNVAHGYVSLYYPPTIRSTAMGLAFGIGRLGAILGPAIAGLLMSLKMSLFVNFMGLAVPGLIAAVTILLVQDKYGYTTVQNKIAGNK
ncbi:MAG TPA: MFS transporter [Negativicutes bacterium]